MIDTIQTAAESLRASGLHVSINGPFCLLIAPTVVDGGGGLRAFKSACALNSRDGLWVAVFPAAGLLSYEKPGSLSDLVAFVQAVYKQHRLAGGELKGAFEGLVQDPEQYLIGRMPVSV